LPGTIFRINVKVGDKVKLGDVLLILEAMKMENNIMSEKAGTVKSILVKEGAAVMQDAPLIEFE
jgi:biotin carboxyl carrier protein